MNRTSLILLLLVCVALTAAALALAVERTASPSAPDGLRPAGTLAEELPAPPIAGEIRHMPRPRRNYPEQPPVVPHSIRDYQIDMNFNTCMSCHSRTQSPETGAIAVSITHYYDRDGQALGAVSPRRYFCLQCHVTQQDISPVRQSTFRDIDQVLIEAAAEREPRRGRRQ